LELQSDAKGELVWPQRPPLGTVTFVADGLDDGYVAVHDTMLVLSGDPPGAFDLAIYLYDSQIAGRVTDEHDQPIADAPVRGWSAPKPATTDEQGEYVLAASSSYGQAMLSAWAPGHAEGRATATLKGPGGRSEVNFRLRPACTVTGHVTDEHGAPIAGARVR